MFYFSKWTIAAATVLALQASPAFSQLLQWTPQQALSDTNTLPGSPVMSDTNLTMDSSPDGTIVGIWVARPDDGKLGIFFSRSADEGLTLSTAPPLDPNYANTRWDQITGKLIFVGNSTWFAFYSKINVLPVSSSNTSLLISTDDGVTWSAPSSFDLESVNRVPNSVASNQDGVAMIITNDAAYPGQAIWRSSDYGVTWDRKYFAGSGSLQSITHTGGASWMAIDGGKILATDDNGESWQSATPNPALNLAGMSDLKSDHNGTLMVISAGPVLLSPNKEFVVWSATSTDNGRNWAPTGITTRSPFPHSFLKYQSKLASFNGDKWLAMWQFPQNLYTPNNYNANNHAWAAISRDQGATWENPVQIVTHVDGDQDQENIEGIGTSNTVVAGWNTVSSQATTVDPWGLDRDIVVRTAVVDPNGPVVPAVPPPLLPPIPPPPPSIPDPIVNIKSSIKLDFKNPSKSFYKISGSLSWPWGYSPDGKMVIVNVGGNVQEFVLDEKGRNKTESGSLAVIEKTTGKYKDKSLQFKVSVRSEILVNDLMDEGMLNENAKNKPMTLKTTISLGTDNYARSQDMLYSAKQGKSGKAK